MSAPDPKAVAAWHDFKAFRETELTAAYHSDYVRTHFPGLRAATVNDDLEVPNANDECLYIRRRPRTGHKGFVSMIGSDNFQVSSARALLDGGGGVNRNFEGLIKQLASFKT